MRKRLLFLLFVLFALSGCAGSNGHTTLNALDKPLAWQDEREKPFGQYDFGKLDEQEFNKLLKEKFKVSLPEYYKDMTITLKKIFVKDQVNLDQVEYFIEAQGEILHLRIINEYKKEQELVFYTSANFEYVFDREQKQVTLKKQSIIVNDATKDGTFPKEDFNQLILNMGHVLNIKGLNKKLDDFNIFTEKEKDKLGDQILFIYDDSIIAKEKNELQKAISVEYNQLGVMRNIYFHIIDAIDEEK